MENEDKEISGKVNEIVIKGLEEIKSIKEKAEKEINEVYKKVEERIKGLTNSKLPETLSYSDVEITYSGRSGDGIVNFLNTNIEQGNGWNSGGFPLGWINVKLKIPCYLKKMVLVCDISPACQVIYKIEIFSHASAKLIEKEEFHTSGQQLEFEINDEVDSIKITTLSSKSWVAWRRMLLYKLLK